jgi:hypothetical protein
METLITLSALFALLGIAYAIYETVTHDKKAKGSAHGQNR